MRGSSKVVSGDRLGEMGDVLLGDVYLSSFSGGIITTQV